MIFLHHDNDVFQILQRGASRARQSRSPHEPERNKRDQPEEATAFEFHDAPRNRARNERRFDYGPVSEP
jgi:hypothetical protein